MPHAASETSRRKKPETPPPVSGPVGEREIVITRDFDAPRELVYAALVDPSHVPKWWGPRGFALETHAIDVRVGGAWRFTMRSEEAGTFGNRIVYRELTAPSRIVYEHGEDRDDDPTRFHVTITFDALDAGRTRVTMRSLFPTAAQRDGGLKYNAVELGQSTLDKGAAHVASALFVEADPTRPVARLRRLLHAPRTLVWEAMTRPEHVAHWYGPRSTRMISCEMDLRVGGQYRFVMRGGDGREHAFSGEYREITPPERMVQTWRWEGAPDARSVETMRLVDLGDRTMVEVEVEHTSRSNLEMHLKHGMEAGANETYQRLDETLVAMVEAPTALVLERTFAAPRKLVFEAWTRAEHFARWFGTRECKPEDCVLDARPGGVIRFVHRFGDQAMYLRGTFDVVEPTTKIVLTLRFVDENGMPTSPSPVSGWPKEASIETTVVLEDAPGGTRQVVTQVVQPASARDSAGVRSERAMAREGWKETLGLLAEHLAGR
jgi:uncharacterized protein YndB with AHSA1/START domain